MNEDTVPISFPLWALLVLYEKSNATDTFINYMEGFQLLANWLGPIDSPTYATIKKIPKLHVNWELNTIAELLNIHPSIVYQTYEDTLWIRA